jgi:phosphoglycerol transferase
MIKFGDKKWLNIGSLLEVFTFTIFLFVYYCLLWVKNTFDNVNMDLIIFNLLSPLDLTRCGSRIRNSFIEQVLSPTVVTLILFIYLFKKYNFYLSIKKFSIKLKIWIMYILFAFLIFFILLKYFSLIEYVGQQRNRTEIYSKYYINPDKIKFKFPEKKRNLIIIFLESIESSYLSKKEGGLFDENLIPELTELARGNINFSNSNNIGGSLQIKGVGWTIGALVGYLSGIPLTIPIQGNEYGKHLKFLPGITTLMDILNKYGYRQVYMIGSDKKFAGNR